MIATAPLGVVQVSVKFSYSASLSVIHPTHKKGKKLTLPAHLWHFDANPANFHVCGGMAIAPIFAALFLGKLQTVDLNTDLRLRKQITLRLKIVPLTRFAEEVSRATGAKIKVNPTITQRKITLICSSREAADVMRSAGEALFLDWQKDGNGYQLVLNRKIADEELDIRQKEESLGREAARDLLSSWVKYKDLSQDALAAELDKQQKLLATQPKDYNEQYRRYTELFTAQPEWGRAIANAGSDTIDRILNGETFVMSDSGNVAMPKGVQVFSPAPNSEGIIEPTPIAATGAIRLIRYDPATTSINAHIHYTGLKGNGLGGDQGRNVLEGGAFEASLKAAALFRTLAAWSQEKDAELSGKAVDPSTKAPPEIWPLQHAYSIADQLEYLADHAHIPVIADGFRLACSPPIYFRAKSVGAFLAQLRQPYLSNTVEAGYTRLDHGWAMYRHAKYWHKLDAEIDQASFEKMEAKPHLSLEDYAQFARGLTPNQIRPILARVGVLSKFSIAPLREGYLPMLLWAQMDEPQRQQAVAAGLPFSSFSSALAATAKRIGLELLMTPGFVPRESVVVGVLGGSFWKSGGLTVRDRSSGALTTAFRQDRIFSEPGTVVPPKNASELGDPYEFSLGSRDNAFTFRFVLNPRETN